MNLSGTSQFNNKITCISSLSVSGTSQYNNNITMLSGLNVGGVATINNQITCLSSLNVCGTTNIGPLYINNMIGTQNTFLNIGLNSSGDA